MLLNHDAMDIIFQYTQLNSYFKGTLEKEFKTEIEG